MTKPIATVALVALTLSVASATAGVHRAAPKDSIGSAPRLAQARLPVAREGKLDPTLRAKVDRLASGATVAVSIWLRVAPLAAGRAEGYPAYLTRLRSYIADRERGLLATLARMRATARASIYAPVVFADLSRAQVLAIASRADVQKIYGDGEYSLTG